MSRKPATPLPQPAPAQAPISNEFQLNEEISRLMASVYADPLAHVMLSYPWDTNPSLQLVRLQAHYAERFGCEYGPDLWQCEFLEDLGRQIKQRGFNGKKAVEPIRFSTVTGHGTGKSTLSAWLIKFIMDTRPFCKGSVTANTDEQLRTKTWAELGKWHRMSLTRHWFDYSNSRGNMALAHISPEYKGQWRVDAKTCREEKSEAFAGQHAPDSTSFYLFDEASAIPDGLFEVREGGLSTGEPMVFDFGNGTRNAGRFYENCQGKFAHRYTSRSVDSRTCTLPSKEKINQDMKDWGEDHDFFRTRWRGMFPSSGTMHFMNEEQVLEATQRRVPNDTAHWMQQVYIGVDVARFGDDASVIWVRLGDDCRSVPPKRFRGIDTAQLTDRVIETIVEYQNLNAPPKLVAVDGTGVGGGVVDQLRRAGYGDIVMDVQMGTSAMRDRMYRCKADELWGNLRDAMPRLLLPAIDNVDGRSLFEQLTQRQFGYTLKGQMALEPKREMKSRGVGSPDEADALALTFARVVNTQEAVVTYLPNLPYMQKVETHRHNEFDYDPLEFI